MQQHVTVLIGEENQYTLQGITSFLQQQQNIEVVAYTSCPAQLINLAVEHKPQVIISSLHPPGATLAKACTQIKDMNVCTGLLVLNPIRTAQVEACFNAGAAGFVQPAEDGDKLIAAIKTVANGDNWYTGAAGAIITAMAKGKGLLARLLAIDLKLIALQCQGYNIRQIAEACHISTGTVTNYRRRFQARLGLRPHQVVAFAIEHGLNLV